MVRGGWDSVPFRKVMSQWSHTYLNLKVNVSSTPKYQKFFTRLTSPLTGGIDPDHSHTETTSTLILVRGP